MPRHDFFRLASIGIVGVPQAWLDDTVKGDIMRNSLALDSAMLTEANNGVPSWLTMYTDPEVIEILLAPLAAEMIFNPVKKGELGTRTAAFPLVEYTGDIAPYGDYSAEGGSDFNTNWPKRDEYAFQTVTKIGDGETQRLSLAKIDAVSRKQKASAAVLKRANNKIWFFGISGLTNYGILNDPNLHTPIAPKPDVNNNLTWADKDADSIYDDILNLYTQLSNQTAGLISSGLQMDAPLKLCLSNRVAPNLKKKTAFGVSVEQMLKDSFPGLEFISAPEYATTSGELIQLIAPEIEGQATGQLGYTELMHAHGMNRGLSHYEEKKSAGNYGTIIYQPFAIAQMIGV